ncbi:hypothetical protein HZH66_008898 [Vespula vulgaris]|uniref:Oxidoreductase-like domain-containing protein n=1 Tax=Vespula vulgaris TaxID=7454 RepID=A0A834N262_VESVU|nr:hypothetical protein HZH66_008898 [Vespula vulgaris]
MNLVRSKVNNVKRQTLDNWKGILVTLRLCSSDNQNEITEPTNCCMSGCTNCVWIQYAEKLTNSLKVSNLDVQKEIMDKIQDPNMKAFLSMELRCRKLIK